MRLMKRLSSGLRRQQRILTKEQWNASYSTGYWDYLHRIDERAHYNMILTYCFEFGGGRQGNLSVLDACCGEGVFLDLLPPSSYQRYVGVDVSEVAIQRAERKQNQNVSFYREEIESFTPSEKFSSIVFNECLYYLRDPMNVLRRYEQFLKPDGVLIVSMYQKKGKAIWKMIENEYSVEDEARVENKNRLAWVVKTIRPVRTQS